MMSNKFNINLTCRHLGQETFILCHSLMHTEQNECRHSWTHSSRKGSRHTEQRDGWESLGLLSACKKESQLLKVIMAIKVSCQK